MKGVYYNEIDPFAAQWLRNLIAAGHIAAGDVDERSIADVRADELLGYAQCHFFAGLGGWPHALRLAGWSDDRPVWTGSCPCPPFSAAGKGSECPSCGGKSCLAHPLVTAGWLCLDCGDEWRGDDRHLLPEFLRLWLECRPADVFGEQVASRDGVLWLHTLRATVELGGYAFGAADLPSAGFGAPHIRQRLMFGSHGLADADRDQQRVGREHRGAPSEGLRSDTDGRGSGFRLGVAASSGREGERDQPEHREPLSANALHGRVGDTGGLGAEPNTRASDSQKEASDRGHGRPAWSRPSAWDDGSSVRLADVSSGGCRSGRGPEASGLRCTEQSSDDDRPAHWLGDAGGDGDREHPRELPGHEGQHGIRSEDRDHASIVAGPTRRLADNEGSGWGEERPDSRGLAFRDPAQGLGSGLVAGSGDRGLGHNGGPGPTNGFWRNPDWLFCRDGKWRPVESGTCPLAHGVPARVGRLRAYGNAINPIQGAAFITAFDGAREQAIRQSVDQRGNALVEA